MINVSDSDQRKSFETCVNFVAVILPFYVSYEGQCLCSQNCRPTVNTYMVYMFRKIELKSIHST